MPRLLWLFCSNLQLVPVELRLNVPWLPREARPVGDLLLGRGSDNTFTMDGCGVPVHILDPASFLTVEPLIFAAQRADAPDRLVLVAGHVPAVWRGALREAGVSFACDDGEVEVTWPGRIAPSPGLALALPHWDALLAQELVIAAADGRSMACAELARVTGASVAEVLAAVGRLADHGLVQLAGPSAASPAPSGGPLAVSEPDFEAAAARAMTADVTVTDVAALEDVLARRTAWPGSGRVAGGYVWGRNMWDVAARISRDAVAAGIDVVVTGRAAAAFFGVVGPTSRSEVWCWASTQGRSLKVIAAELKLEPVPWDDANVMVAADPHGIGTGHRASVNSGEWMATVAHPLRIWCDLHHERRGLDLAGKLWPKPARLPRPAARWSGPARPPRGETRPFPGISWPMAPARRRAPSPTR